MQRMLLRISAVAINVWEPNPPSEGDQAPASSRSPSLRASGALVIAFAVSCLFVSGCGQGGPAMHHISGSITFDGKPIESGRIDFLPDTEKKNDGPQGFAYIKSGKFDTRNEGQGHAGGPMIVRVEGFDGKTDKPKWFGNRIFAAYDIAVDLPKKDSEQSFDVPATAAKKSVSKAANPKS